MEEKYIKRAADILAQIAEEKLKNLKEPEKAAQDFLKAREDLTKYESMFNASSVEIIYNYLKSKYYDIAFSPEIEKLLREMKTYSGKDDPQSIVKSRVIYNKIIYHLKQIEAKIKEEHPDYTPKYL